MFRILGIITTLTQHRPFAGEGKAFDAVLCGAAGGNKGILVVDIVCGDHSNLIPKVAVLVGILRNNGISPGVPEYVEGIIATPVHGSGTIVHFTVLQPHITVFQVAVAAIDRVLQVGIVHIKAVHAVCDVKIQVDGSSDLAILIIEVPVGEDKLLAVVENVCTLHENGSGLIEGQ